MIPGLRAVAPPEKRSRKRLPQTLIVFTAEKEEFHGSVRWACICAVGLVRLISGHYATLDVADPQMAAWRADNDFRSRLDSPILAFTAEDQVRLQKPHPLSKEDFSGNSPQTVCHLAPRASGTHPVLQARTCKGDEVGALLASGDRRNPPMVMVPRKAWEVFADSGGTLLLPQAGWGRRLLPGDPGPPTAPAVASAELGSDSDDDSS